MKKVQMTNVVLVASVSAALHGVMAILFVPVMSVIFLAQRAPRLTDSITENGMIIAVVAPVCWAAIGFVGGALMGFLWNLFAAEPGRSLQFASEPLLVRTASQSTAA